MGESLVAREFESGIPIKVVPVPTVNTPPPGPKAAYRILSGSNVALSPGYAIYPKPVCHVPNLVHPLLRILRLNRPTSPGLCARAPADRSLQLRPRHTSHIGQGRKLFNHRYWCDGYWLHGTRRPPVTKRSGEGEGPPRTPPDQTLLVNLRSRLREKRSAHGAFHILGCGTLVSVPCPPGSSSCGFTFERPHRRSRRHRSSLV